MGRWVGLFFAARLWAGSCEDLLNDAEDLMARKEFAAAASRLELAPAECRTEERVMLQLAHAYLLGQRFEESLHSAANATAMHPRSVAAWRARADAQYLLGHDDEAERALRQALTIEPRNEDAAYSLGRIYYYRSRYRQALDLFEKITGRNAAAYKAWDNLGLCQEALGQTQEAIGSFLRSIELARKAQPGYEWPYANLANLLLKKGENRRAFDLAVEAATRNPESAVSFYLAGKALTKLDQWEKSVRWLDRAVQLDAAYPEPHYLLATVYRQLGQGPAAERELLIFKDLREKAVNRPR